LTFPNPTPTTPETPQPGSQPSSTPADQASPAEACERRLSDKKREAIVEAAIHEFHARGFPATSMDAIAATAGVSKRTIYNHFQSKDDLFRAISGEACRRILELWNEPYRPGDPLEEQLASIAHRKLDLMGSPDFLKLVRVTLAERVRRPEIAQEAFAEIEKGEFGATVWIRAAVADGRLNVPDPVEANRQFSALLKEFALWPQLFGSKPPLSDAERKHVVDTTVAMFLKHYGA